MARIADAVKRQIDDVADQSATRMDGHTAGFNPGLRAVAGIDCGTYWRCDGGRGRAAMKPPVGDTVRAAANARIRVATLVGA